MHAYFDGNIIAEIPDVMNVGDTIILDNGVYEIVTKTIDLTVENKQLYCKTTKYHEPKEFAVDVLRKLYAGDYFVTSGPNTNKFDANPRIIVLLVVLSAIIDGELLKNDVKKYKNSISLNWHNGRMLWEDIIPSDLESIRSVEEATPIITEMLKAVKIGQSMWPEHIIT